MLICGGVGLRARRRGLGMPAKSLVMAPKVLLCRCEGGVVAFSVSLSVCAAPLLLSLWYGDVATRLPCLDP